MCHICTKGDSHSLVHSDFWCKVSPSTSSNRNRNIRHIVHFQPENTSISGAKFCWATLLWSSYIRPHPSVCRCPFTPWSRRSCAACSRGSSWGSCRWAGWGRRRPPRQPNRWSAPPQSRSVRPNSPESVRDSGYVRSIYHQVYINRVSQKFVFKIVWILHAFA